MTAANPLQTLVDIVGEAIEGGKRAGEEVPKAPSAGPSKDADKEFLTKLAEAYVMSTELTDGETFQTRLALARGVAAGVTDTLQGLGVESVLKDIGGLAALEAAAEATYGDLLRRLKEKTSLETLARLLDVSHQTVILPRDALERAVSEEPDTEGNIRRIEALGISVPLGGGELREIPSALRLTLAPLLKAARYGGRWMKALYKGMWGDDPPKHSSLDGQLAHTAIQLHYVLSHADHAETIICDSYVVQLGLSVSKWLPLVTKAGGFFDVVKKGLTNEKGELWKPDILDLTSREVYEIKPLGQAAEGAIQLYGQYLIPLNGALFGAEIVKAITEAYVQGKPVDLSLHEKPFSPGTWQPSPFYIIPPDRAVAVVRPIPGLILYQVVPLKISDMKTVEELGYGYATAMYLMAVASATKAAAAARIAIAAGAAEGTLVLGQEGWAALVALYEWLALYLGEEAAALLIGAACAV